MNQLIVVAIALALLVNVSAYMKASPMTRVATASVTSLNLIKISVGDEEAIENVLKRFKKVVNQSGYLMDMRTKEQWESAQDKRKRKTERARQLNRIERTNDRYERKNDGTSEYNS